MARLPDYLYRPESSGFLALLVAFLIAIATWDVMASAVLYIGVPAVGAIFGTNLEVESNENYILYGYGLGSLVALFIVLWIARAILRTRLETSRECPYCISRIPLAARRCAFCAEALEPIKVSDGRASP